MSRNLFHFWAPLAAALFASRAPAATYTITDLGQLPAAESGTYAYALNNAGQVAGHSGHPFVWRNGLTDANAALPASIIAPSPARDINDSGVVVGSFYTSGSVHPFRWAAGTFTDLAPAATVPLHAVSVNAAGTIAILGPSALQPSYLLNADGTKTALSGFGAGSLFFPAGLNDAGQVAGSATMADYTTHAALWQDGTSQDLGTLPGDLNSAAHGLNAAGLVVGASYGATSTAANTRAFLWHYGSLSPLSPRRSGEPCVAVAVNGLGQVVGYAGTDHIPSAAVYTSGESAALLWEDGQVEDLQALIPSGSGWTLLAAEDINDAGQITGFGAHNGGVRAFLLTPDVPPGVPGDADGNGVVTGADAAAIMEMAAGLAPLSNLSRLDVAPSPSPAFRGYGDGRIDLLDALRVLRRAESLESHWP